MKIFVKRNLALRQSTAAHMYPSDIEIEFQTSDQSVRYPSIVCSIVSLFRCEISGSSTTIRFGPFYISQSRYCKTKFVIVF